MAACSVAALHRKHVRRPLRIRLHVTGSAFHIWTRSGPISFLLVPHRSGIGGALVIQPTANRSAIIQQRFFNQFRKTLFREDQGHVPRDGEDMFRSSINLCCGTVIRHQSTSVERTCPVPPHVDSPVPEPSRQPPTPIFGGRHRLPRDGLDSVDSRRTNAQFTRHRLQSSQNRLSLHERC